MHPSLRAVAPPSLRRRTLLAGAGLAAVAVGGLSACGASGAPTTESSAGPQRAKTADIPVGGGTIFPGSQTVITQPTAGEFKAFSSICTHAGCPVTEVTTSINCLCHGSKFSLTDGSVVAGPAPDPLPAKAATVSGDVVEVAA